MPKKNWTEDERKAFGEKMKAARSGKQEAQPKKNSEQNTNITLTKEQFDELMSRVNKLEAQPTPQPQAGSPQIDSTGRPIGVTEKYSIDPAHYQDPSEALYNMRQFARDALRENYVIKWTVNPTRYQTVFGTWYIEPRFEIVLYKRRFDDDGNERPDRIVVKRSSFFQDPAADMLEADLAGIDYTTMSQEDFSEAMRLWRYYQFVWEALHPPKIKMNTNKKKLEVIGGTAVEVEEYSNPV